MVDGFVSTVIVDIFTVQLDGPGHLLADAKQGFHNVGALGAHQPGNAQDLPLMQIERDIADRRLAQRGQAFHL
ncbi:hypothetical protein D3C78_1749380 [compost metagenome]